MGQKTNWVGSHLGWVGSHLGWVDVHLGWVDVHLGWVDVHLSPIITWTTRFVNILKLIFPNIPNKWRVES
jgi:hypothetical protein